MKPFPYKTAVIKKWATHYFQYLQTFYKPKIIFAQVIIICTTITITYIILNSPRVKFTYDFMTAFAQGKSLDTFFGLQYKSNADVSQFIQINKPEDVDQKRKELIQMIWAEGYELPQKMPLVTTGIYDQDFSKLANLKRIDSLTTTMDYGFNSIYYIFYPLHPNGKLIIYHQGHLGSFARGKDTINFFLAEGYTVMAYSMPLYGYNNHPVVNLPHAGSVQFSSHDQLQYLEPFIHGLTLKFFVEPIVEGVNYVTRLGFTQIAMLGISGGGWTTTLAAAVDTRIQKSYPAAGSAPTFIRFENTNDFGDYEQHLPGLWPKLGYLELYILGATGDGRRQIMIYNEHDPCCYGGMNYERWAPTIKNKLSAIKNGTFDVFLDEKNKEHSISPDSLKRILQDLQN